MRLTYLAHGCTGQDRGCSQQTSSGSWCEGVLIVAQRQGKVSVTSDYCGCCCILTTAAAKGRSIHLMIASNLPQRPTGVWSFWHTWWPTTPDLIEEFVEKSFNVGNGYPDEGAAHGSNINIFKVAISFTQNHRPGPHLHRCPDGHAVLKNDATQFHHWAKVCMPVDLCFRH